MANQPEQRGRPAARVGVLPEQPARDHLQEPLRNHAVHGSIRQRKEDVERAGDRAADQDCARA